MDELAAAHKAFCWIVSEGHSGDRREISRPVARSDARRSDLSRRGHRFGDAVGSGWMRGQNIEIERRFFLSIKCGAQF